VFKRAIALFTILFPFPLSRGRGYRGWGYLIIIRRGKKTLERGFLPHKNKVFVGIPYSPLCFDTPISQCYDD